jgi:DNA processing protein
MELKDSDLLWLELALTPEVQPRHLHSLLNALEDVRTIFGASHLTLGSVEGMTPGAAAGIAGRAGKEAAERELEFVTKNGVSIVSYESALYPPLLREVIDPPFVLYALGSLAATDHDAVSVVGSRNTSAYGAQAAHRLSGDLAKAGLTVVSGMAFGIDQAAHNGALASGGRTIAVLGSGLARIYPARCEKLVERIKNNGAVITEFHHEVAPGKGTFPQRNRIVSGMSYATLVVEAGERSGALITARLALEQGRELLAVPGAIYSDRSFGTNYLIKSGAKLIQRVEDIIEELPEAVRSRLKLPEENTRNMTLNEMEEQIVSVLSVDTPLHIDIIAARLGMRIPDLSLQLLGLEMREIVRQLPGMEYIKAI